MVTYEVFGHKLGSSMIQRNGVLLSFKLDLSGPRRFWDPSHCTVLCRVCSNHHPAVLHENRVKTVLIFGAFVSSHRLSYNYRNWAELKKHHVHPFRFHAACSGQDPQEAA